MIVESDHSIHALGEQLASYLTEPQIKRVKHAYFYAEQAHEGQRRRSGEPYITHPLAVAEILADMHMDHQSLMAAMLHDVIEDTGIPKSAITEQFGETVADLVDGVSKLTQIEFRSKAEAQAENFQKMALAMAQDLRVILVKLADRLHNMRTLGVLNPDKRRRIAKETLEIYAPIANRLGMNNIRVEFEELCFAAMYPMRATRIRNAMKQVRGHRKVVIEEIQEALQESLSQENIKAEVFGREKHLFSVYNKMKSKRKPFSEIMDFFAFRILVDSPDTCYRVLGIIHSLYKPVAGQFKDYIAIPKANGYQSLHTILFGIHGIPIEIQIRTHEMEEMANNGISAHWLYKSDADESPYFGSHVRAKEWIKGLLELQQQAGNSLEFIEHAKVDLFPDEIYVFTPGGDILELPANATAVDFAYAVHTDVGNTCTGCRINKRSASLSQPLQSGQTVEIETQKNAQPNPAWLSFVVSGKAQSNIRHYLKNQQLDESIILGQRLLGKALKNINADIDTLTEGQKNAVVAETNCKDFHHLLEDIGLGNRVAYIAAQQLVAHSQHSADADGEIPEPVSQGPLTINGTEGVSISYARCCHPIPGDPIIGYMSTGRGIIVHIEGCNNVAEIQLDPLKCTHLNWAEDIQREFTVELQVELEHQRGIIAVLATRINSLDANIEKISVEDKNARHMIVRLEVTVENRVHLARIMRRIRTMKSVNRVTRTKNKAS